jgi:hypothetical protein
MTSEPTLRPTGRPSNWRVARISFALLAPLAAVFLQQQAAVALVGPACRGHSTIAIHLLALPTVGIVGAALWLARGEWDAARPPARDGGVHPPRFVALVGFAVGGLALLLALAQWLPLLFLSPCQR